MFDRYSFIAGVKSLCRIIAKVPNDFAPSRMASLIPIPGGDHGSMSKRSGSGISTTGGGVTESAPVSSNSRAINLRPISVVVLMYSRPWMPSLVGLTISDISVHMASKPGPEKAPP